MTPAIYIYIYDGFKILRANVYLKMRLPGKLPENFRKMQLPGKLPESFRKKATQIHNFRYALPNVYVRVF